MKNTHILNLDFVIPCDIRLQTYIDALEYCEQRKWDVKDMAEGDYSDGLCLVLPCIMWDLYNYLSIAPDGEVWSWMYTQDAFPELGRDIGKIFHQFGKKNKDTVRMELLRNWIKELSDD